MAKYPVVVYGASGYTGMLTMDWLIDQNIPFTAVARDAKRVKEMMAQRVVRLESATYEIIEAQNDVESLTKAFTGAKVVCNTVGPFIKYGLIGVEAALNAGCHHIDTTGEQGYIRAVRDQFGELYAQAGLVVSPSIAYMYSYSEIAAELALEHPGIDALQTSALCRGPRGGAAGITVGSTASIFEMYRSSACYLWDNELVPHAANKSYSINSPDFMDPVFALPWGGTSLPVYFENDPRVRSCESSVGFYDNDAMKMVHMVGEKWEAEHKDLPAEQQDAVLQQLTESTTPAMPPRERTTLVRTVDTAIGRGVLSAVRATVYGTTAYIATGALQTAAVIKLLDNDVNRVGFTSGSKAFGHRYLLGFLEERGLARASVTEL
jgi:short subunit dehydrogenase-like uncharacterized protein